MRGRPVQVTDDAIVEAVRAAGVSIRSAAAAIGVTRRCLYLRLRRHEELRYRARRAGWQPAGRAA